MSFVVEWSKANLSVWVRIHLTMKDLTENERLKYFNYGITYQQAVLVNQFDRLVINKKPMWVCRRIVTSWAKYLRSKFQFLPLSVE